MKTIHISYGGPDRRIKDATGKVWRFEMHPYSGPTVQDDDGELPERDDEQASNRRRAAPVTAFGVKRTCRETAQLFGVSERTLYRWSRGGTVDVGSLITSSAARATTQSVVGQ